MVMKRKKLSEKDTAGTPAQADNEERIGDAPEPEEEMGNPGIPRDPAGALREAGRRYKRAMEADIRRRSR
jgi:hypothetical protein